MKIKKDKVKSFSLNKQSHTRTQILEMLHTVLIVIIMMVIVLLIIMMNFLFDSSLKLTDVGCSTIK